MPTNRDGIMPPPAMAKLIEENPDLSDEELLRLAVETLTDDELVEFTLYSLSPKPSH